MKIWSKDFKVQVSIHGSKPKDWELIRSKDKKGLLQYKGETKFIFPNTWSRQFLIFDYLFNNGGVYTEYKELYECCYNMPYPEQGKRAKVNQGLQRELNFLKKRLSHLPLNFDTEKGVIFVMANHP
jgi:hypothetical protein